MQILALCEAGRNDAAADLLRGHIELVGVAPVAIDRRPLTT
ncbi:hypothetical protein [Methylobacterium sp. NEAU K]|nr:hypothetical protein [Methylobacterium sp. NEAU K]MDP4006007.1 hypothetical protein [Methylobacterium sp. NEAU K]